MLWKISVIVMHQFVLVAAVVHKQRFTGGPPDLSIHCVNFNYRVNTVGCARGLSTHATYNYAFLMHDGNCFQCRVVDVNGTSTDEVPLRGPQFFTGNYCPSGWFEVVGYGCYSIARRPMNWNNAIAHCEGQGAYLATIETVQENEYLERTLKTYEDDLGIFTLRRPWFWLAGNDVDVEGDWRWVTTGQAVSFNNWMGGGPNNAGGNQHCMVYVHTHRVWRDDPCSYNLPAICEM